MSVVEESDTMTKQQFSICMIFNDYVNNISSLYKIWHSTIMQYLEIQGLNKQKKTIRILLPCLWAVLKPGYIYIYINTCQLNNICKVDRQNATPFKG